MKRRAWHTAALCPLVLQAVVSNRAHCAQAHYAPFHRVKIPGQTRKFIMSCNDNRAEFKSSWEAREIKTTNCLLCIIHYTTAKSAYQLNDIYELCMRPKLRQECMVNFTRFLQKKWRWYYLDQNNFFSSIINPLLMWKLFFKLFKLFTFSNWSLPVLDTGFQPERMWLTLWDANHPKARFTQ